MIVDDERSICELLEISFRKEGHKVEVASNGEAAKRRLASQIFDIVVSDICMPDMDGVELLRYCKEVSPATTFILITGVPTIDTAIDAVNFGADRYVIKGDRLLDELRPAVEQVCRESALKKEAGDLRRQLRGLPGFDHIIGTSSKMRSLFELIENDRAAIQPRTDHRRKRDGKRTDRPRNSRKQRSVQSIHSSPSIAARSRKRCSNPNSSATCGERSPEQTKTAGDCFQAADGGTLFMDEIGNMSLTMQVKLYRVLQEGKVRPLGSTEESDVDVRVIAATNKDLEKEIAEGRFAKTSTIACA